MLRRSGRRAVQRNLLFLPGSILVGLLLVGNASATGSTYWNAPYAGTTHETHHGKGSYCGTFSKGGLHVDLTNGRFTGGGATTASASCAGSNSVSSGDLHSSVGMVLPSVTGYGGSTSVVAHWRLDLQIDLSVSGTNCLSGAYAVVVIGFGVIVADATTGAIVASDVKVESAKLYSPGTKTDIFTHPLTDSLTTTLTATSYYDVIPEVSVSMGSAAPSPASPATSTCTADASFQGHTTNKLATVEYADII